MASPKQLVSDVTSMFVGGSEMLMGLCITVTCIVELPIFAANNWILKTLGVNSVIHLTLAVCAIRMVSLLYLACNTCIATTWSLNHKLEIEDVSLFEVAQAVSSRLTTPRWSCMTQICAVSAWLCVLW